MPIRSEGTVRRSRIRTAGGGWQDCNVYVRSASGTGWDVISLALPDPTTSGSGSVTDNVREPAPPTRNMSNGNVVVAPTGGYGPFTYSWARISGSSAMTVDNANVAQPIFRATVPKNSVISATWRCTVTDTTTGLTGTIDRAISLSYLTNL